MKSLLCAVVVCLFSVACDKGPTSPTAPTTPMMDPPVVTPPVVTPPSDFVGRVATPINTDRNNNKPVPGVTVTILAGLRSGESVQTDRDGRYVIPDFDGDELKIRLEKSRYETKVVIVHRMKPTEVLGQGSLGYQGPQQTPGTVLIGLEWPLKIKDIMRQMPVVPDLLLVLYGPSFPDGINLFASGVVGVSDLKNMHIMAHEVCHAHQQWVVAPQGKYGGVGTMWNSSSEGQAYELARQTDWNDVGKTAFDLDPRTSSRREGAAETCARWWGVDKSRPEYTRPWLRVNAPDRARWGKDRLTKR